MNKKIKLIYLILLLALNFSCVEKKSTEKQTNKPELVVTSKTDTLKFTSGIRAIFQDSKGNYWLGSHNEGVSFYNGKSFEYFTTNEGLSHNQIRSIQEDENGKIWFECGIGLSIYDGQKMAIYKERNYDSINEWKLSDNDLWFKSDESMGNNKLERNPGVYQFDGKTLFYRTFPVKPKSGQENLYSISTNFVRSKNGAVWFGTYGALIGYNGSNFKIIDNEYLGLNEQTGFLHIRSIMEDSKGNLWIGNNGIGVLLMEGNSIINFSEKNNLIHPTSTRRGDKSKPGTLEHVFAIEEDSEGNIWFGDRDTGAWKYDGKTLTNYSISDKSSNPMIWTIYKDNKNNLLFGMADRSIYKFNGKAFEKQF